VHVVYLGVHMKSVLRSLKLVVQGFVFATGLLGLIEWLLVRRNGSNCVRIFYGHHVSDDDVSDVLTRTQFGRILRWLSHRYEIVSLAEAVVRLRTEEKFKRGVAVITFDDGYRDNLTNAIPELVAKNIPATIFVATAPLICGTRLWYDQVCEWLVGTGREQITVSWASRPLSLTPRSQAARAIVEDLKRCEAGERRSRMAELSRALDISTSASIRLHETVSVAELLAMAAMPGIDIGGHTVSHPILARTESDEARREITDNAKHLELLLGRRPTLFAYPNGSFTDAHIAVLREAGYEVAVTTASGVNLPGQDPYRLMRLSLGHGPLCRFAWQSTVVPLRQALKQRRQDLNGRKDVKV
jgi:peptidoglycan/xylan/chitin deacetylase (PgdA/CDA1 family)